MEKEHSLVSVVVPVYKAEKSIKKCVYSVLGQTYSNFELILVDDGSPDNSGRICDLLSEEDSRIRVIHKENGGVSTARNRGIEEAKGEFLFFVDSDDWVEGDHINNLLPVEGEDLIYGGRKFFTHGKFVEERKIPARIAYKDEWKNNFLDFGIGKYALFFPSPCYRMDIIKRHHLRYDTTLSIGEDGIFNLHYMKHIEKIRYETSCTYCYEDGDEGDVTLSRTYNENRERAELTTMMAIEAITGKKEYLLRYHHWCAIFNHLNKWQKIGSPDVRRKTIRNKKACYKNEYFRECLPYVRREGTLDQKVETYFMSYILHPLYKPFYSIVIGLYQFKNIVFK